MEPQPPRRRSRSIGRQAADVVFLVGFVYLATHPDQLDRLQDWMRERADGLTHRVSVWRAVWAIRSLPETGRDR